MNARPGGETEALGIDRRRFLTLGVLGGGASLLALRAGVSWAADEVPVLLLSCMDYRLVTATERYMADQGLQGKYDHVILAGASLGAVTDKFPAWGKTFREHLDVAIKLHKISKVIVLDHRDCGAYKEILGAKCCKDPEKETAVHAQQLNKLRKRIRAAHPKLVVELLLMSLDGKVMPISIT